MFKIRYAALAAVIMAAVASVATAQQAVQAGLGAAIPDGKIAVINTQAFPDAINELKQKYEQVNNQFKARQQKLQDDDARLKSMANDLQTKQGILAADKYAQLQQDAEELKKRLQRDYEDTKSDYDKSVDTTTKPVRDKLYQFLQTYATQRGIVMILNLAGAAQTGTLAYWNPGADITEDFVAEYNKANPVAGGAPAAAPRPATAPPPTKKP
jgi:outer membrane protein